MSSGLAVGTKGTQGRRWKRYPAYRDSGVAWLGEVPAGWEVKRLKRMFRVINGSTPKSGISDYWDGDISWVTPDDLGRLKSDTINETARKITDLGYQSCGTTLAPAGSLVLSTRAPIGHLAIAEIDLCTNQGCRSLIFKYGNNKRYFYYQLLAARSELESWGQGSTFRELGKSKLEAIELFSPPIPEQRAIAAFLDRETAKIDALAAKKERLADLLEEKRTALISHAVTRGLDPDAPMKDSGIEWLGEVPEGWAISKLGTKCSVKARLGWRGLKASEYVEEGYIFLSTPNIKYRNIDFGNVNYITAERYFESPEIVLDTGDVLIVKDGSTLGITNVVRSLPAPSTVNSSIAVIRPKQSCDSVFLYYFLTSNYIQSFIQRMKGGMGVPHLFQADLRKFVIITPPRPEQRAIAALLDRETTKIDALTKKIYEQIAKLREYRTALISAAVTGKMDVRGEMP